MLKHVNVDSFKEEVLENARPILVDFFATWCGPCNMIAPILESIGNENQFFDVAKIDIDESRDLAYEYKIEAVPTMIVFKDGKELNRIEGTRSKSEIIEFVESQVK